MERTPEQRLDHALSIETIILDGLSVAVHNGSITEDDKQAWLNEYIDKRNAEPNRLAQAVIDAMNEC